MTESRRYVLSFQARKEQDRRTDGQTDGKTSCKLQQQSVHGIARWKKYRAANVYLCT